jgi:hypothetical protein
MVKLSRTSLGFFTLPGFAVPAFLSAKGAALATAFFPVIDFFAAAARLTDLAAVFGLALVADAGRFLVAGEVEAGAALGVLGLTAGLGAGALALVTGWGFSNAFSAGLSVSSIMMDLQS